MEAARGMGAAGEARAASSASPRGPLRPTVATWPPLRARPPYKGGAGRGARRQRRAPTHRTASPPLETKPPPA
eukprot:scaffold1549_cov350-Prasinococcus_capsulatus_cf.AAC.27